MWIDQLHYPPCKLLRGAHTPQGHGRDQVFVHTTEEFGARPEETYASVLAFLGAPPHSLRQYPRVFDRDYPPMLEETRRALTERFAEPNRRLERLLGRPLPWPAE